MTRKDELIQEIIANSSNAVRTPERLAKLVSAWEGGLNTMSALSFETGMSKEGLSRWLEDEPLFNELRELCYSRVNTLARNNIMKALKKGSVETSKWFLERTDPEFSKKEPQNTTNIALISVSDREKALSAYMERFVLAEDNTALIESEENDERTDEPVITP